MTSYYYIKEEEVTGRLHVSYFSSLNLNSHVELLVVTAVVHTQLLRFIIHTQSFLSHSLSMRFVCVDID